MILENKVTQSIVGKILRLITAILIPFAAFMLQWFFWDFIHTPIWILLCLAVFFSSLIGGKKTGCVATASSMPLGWFLFPEHYSSKMVQPEYDLAIEIFSIMSVLFSITPYRKANQRTSESLADVSDQTLKPIAEFAFKNSKTIFPCWQKATFVASLSIFLAGSAGFFHAAAGQVQSNASSVSSHPPTSNSGLNSLTEEERAWLRDHPIIRVAQDPSWPPIEFTDERGAQSGMTSDYLKLIEQRLGLKFERVQNLSWQEAYARMKRWEIDMTTTVAVTSERKAFWAFTKPYMTIPIVIVTSVDVPFIADIRELAGKKVAVVDGYVASVWISRDFPEIQLVRVKTTKEALAMLQRGEVFACVENMLAVGYYISQQKISNLKISGTTPYNNAQCMAVRKDWAILAGILDKALDSISEAERKAIYRRWLPIRYEYGFDYNLFWQVVAISAVVMLALGVWIWKLTTEIKNRQYAEAGLRKSEQEFRTLAEAVPQIVWITRPDGCNIFFNQQWMDYTGMTMEESYGHGWNKPFHPDDQQRAWDAWQQATATSRIYALECRLRRADGVYRWWLIRGVPVLDSEGKVLKWFGTCTDIEEIKQANQVLRESEERLRLFIEQAPAPIAMLDENMNYVAASNRWLSEHCGKERDLIGRNMYEVFPDIPERWKEIHRRCLSGAVESSEADPWVRADGGTDWVRWEMRPWHKSDDTIGGLVVFSDDITESKHAEDALAATSKLLQEVTDNSPALIYTVDTAGKFLLINRRFEAVLGVPSATLIGKTRESFMPPEIAAQHLANDQQVIVGQQPITFEEENEEIDGEHTYLTIKFPLFDLQGAVSGICGISTDITGRKRDEERIFQQLRELQRWQNVMLNREDRVIELKKEVNDLLAGNGQPPRYPSAVC